MTTVTKAERTRERILQCALQVFRDKGYDGTTMRAIASQAQVSVGSAYYYYASKEHLIQAFYDQIHAEHAVAARQAFAGTTSYSERLDALLTTWVDVAAEYHDFAGTFFKTAADPSSPLSPFSPESSDARDASIDLHREAIEGSDLKVGTRLRAELPDLMWLMQMGVVLFWVYDDSVDQRRTRTLVHQLVPVIDRLLRLSRLPVVRRSVDDIVQLIAAVRAR